MKVTPLAGTASTRTTMLQMLTQTAGAATASGITAFVARPVAAAPPPRASSFGGADPRAMFEALVQSFDRDGDGKLSLDEVNALNQGGLLSRSFARIDSNFDGKISGDEVATQVPWGAGTLPTGDHTGERGANIRPLTKVTDQRNSNSDAAISADNHAFARDADFAKGVDRFVTPQGLTRTANVVAGSPSEPVTLMESMVLALSATLPTEHDTARAKAIKQIYAAR